MELQEPAALGVYRCGTDSLGRDVWMVQREDPGPDPDLTNGETRWRRKGSIGGWRGLSREAKESPGGVASQKPKEGSERKGHVTMVAAARGEVGTDTAISSDNMETMGAGTRAVLSRGGWIQFKVD